MSAESVRQVRSTVITLFGHHVYYGYHLIWVSRLLWLSPYLGMLHFIIENFQFFTIYDNTSSTKKETKNVEIRPFSS